MWGFQQKNYHSKVMRLGEALAHERGDEFRH